jgi:hypothetical protein
LLCHVLVRGFVGIAKALLSRGVNANIVSKSYNRTPFHAAAGRGYIDIVNALLSKDGVIVDAVDGDNCTPLRCAAEKGHVNVVKALLARGANANICSGRFNRTTPLHVAASGGHVAVVNALLNKKDGVKVIVDATDGDNRTPLHYAAGRGHVDVVNALLTAGADTGITSKEYKNTPLDEAMDYFRLWHNTRDNETKMKVAKNFIDIHKAITEFHEKNKNSKQLPVANYDDKVGDALSKAKKLLAKDAVEGSAETKETKK